MDEWERWCGILCRSSIWVRWAVYAFQIELLEIDWIEYRFAWSIQLILYHRHCDNHVGGHVDIYHQVKHKPFSLRDIYFLSYDFTQLHYLRVYWSLSVRVLVHLYTLRFLYFFLLLRRMMFTLRLHWFTDYLIVLYIFDSIINNNKIIRPSPEQNKTNAISTGNRLNAFGCSIRKVESSVATHKNSYGNCSMSQ